jgi:16S rRNA (guanine527-N7)-methyltransferase
MSESSRAAATGKPAVGVGGTSGIPATPDIAHSVFGSRFPLVEQYVVLLATAGVQRGLIGPREVGRLWERHILNCVVVQELISPGAMVCDLGSGAGLPGLVLALARPDLRVILLEPLLRRTTFLTECRDALDLDNVTVLRSRAEEQAGRLRVDVVTARAVAPLNQLAAWALPLLRPEGQLLAIKGDSAATELQAARAELKKLGAVQCAVTHLGHDVVEPATTLVRIQAGQARAPHRRSGRASRRF